MLCLLLRQEIYVMFITSARNRCDDISWFINAAIIYVMFINAPINICEVY